MTPPRTATISALAAALLGSVGCLWRPKPYTTDPLVRGRRATLANPATAPHGPEPAAAPVPPLPPDEPATAGPTPGR
jgi:hypothetical protein